MIKPRMTADLNIPRAAEEREAKRIKCCGITRDPEMETLLFLYFSRRPTDEEIRRIQAAVTGVLWP